MAIITAGTNSTSPINPILKGSFVMANTSQLIKVACMVSTMMKKKRATMYIRNSKYLKAAKLLCLKNLNMNTKFAFYLQIAYGNVMTC